MILASTVRSRPPPAPWMVNVVSTGVGGVGVGVGLGDGPVTVFLSQPTYATAITAIATADSSRGRNFAGNRLRCDSTIIEVRASSANNRPLPLVPVPKSGAPLTSSSLELFSGDSPITSAADADADVVTVTVVLTAALPGVSDAGSKLQALPLGRPVQLNVTASAKLPPAESGVTVTV